jgi:hypothetical protein
MRRGRPPRQDHDRCARADISAWNRCQSALKRLHSARAAASVLIVSPTSRSLVERPLQAPLA